MGVASYGRQRPPTASHKHLPASDRCNCSCDAPTWILADPQQPRRTSEQRCKMECEGTVSHSSTDPQDVLYIVIEYRRIQTTTAAATDDERRRTTTNDEQQSPTAAANAQPLWWCSFASIQCWVASFSTVRWLRCAVVECCTFAAWLLIAPRCPSATCCVAYLDVLRGRWCWLCCGGCVQRVC